MKLNIIIPFSNTNMFRRRNLDYCVQYYRNMFPDSSIIISEQNSDSDLVDLDIDYHIKVKSKEYFWKSRVINDAVNTINNDDPIMMVDNDCMISSDFIDHLPESYDVITPFDDITFLNEMQTRKYIKSDGNEVINGKRDLPVYRYTGGITLFTKDAFNKLNGFDEEFHGWGGEDCAFIEKCQKIGLKYDRTKGRVTHIFHPDESKNKNENYTDNREVLLAVKFMSKDQLIDKINNKKTYQDFYDELRSEYGDRFIVDIVTNVCGAINLTFDNSIYAIKDELSLENILTTFYNAGDVEIVKSIANTLDRDYQEVMSEDDKCQVKKFLSI
jgi:hypothetical protein